MMLISEVKFELPQSLNATIPPERRGIRRDHVRLMVLNRLNGETEHTQFYKLEKYLHKGDLLVLNCSRTLPAVLTADWHRNGQLLKTDVEIRLARRLNDSVWESLVVADEIVTGDHFNFSKQLQATVLETDHKPFVSLRFSLSGPLLYDQIYALGEPVRYEYIEHPWGLDYYQTVFATAPGSVEMPSAGRAFSWELIFKLQRKGIGIAFVQLHTGLSYLLDDWQHDPSLHYEEYHIPGETIEAIKRTKESGGRVIAVGTTVVRSLETAYRSTDAIFASGWTNLKITHGYPLRIVDGLITGFHEPEASHLELLSAFIEPQLLHQAYLEAIERQYLWHEFGDMNLIL
jgi:S-adenosylmethionine:tRNA ribosyltransferase-isomerase